MIIYHHLEAFLHARLKTAKRSVQIYCPYVRSNTLSQLLGSLGAEIVVEITMRWSPQEFAHGACDPEVYSLCKSRRVCLRKNPRLHLKMFVIDGQELIAGSANLSAHALGSVKPSNFEFMVTGSAVSSADREMFVEIDLASVSVSEEDYHMATENYDNLAGVDSELLDRAVEAGVPLLSQIPLIESPKELWVVYQSGGHHPILEAYHVPPGLDGVAFASVLQCGLLSTPIVRELTLRLRASDLYFGELKRWLLETCQDAKGLGARDVGKYASTLLTWLTHLGPPRYLVDQPNVSERLRYIPETTHCVERNCS